MPALSEQLKETLNWNKNLTNSCITRSGQTLYYSPAHPQNKGLKLSYIPEKDTKVNKT